MTDLAPVPTSFDFGPLHAAMRRHVDGQILAGVSHAVLQGRDLVDLACVGWADREREIPLRADHVFRVFSNTKLVTSCAVLMLMEDGRLLLDDPVETWIPQLGRLQVLKPGATSLADTEPARGPITIRHLLTHASGLSYGLLDPGSLLFDAYNERRVLHPARTLAQMMDSLAELPLLFHPGSGWEYSVSTDVLGRLVELISGQPLDEFFRVRIFAPLGMVDTDFVVPQAQLHRLAAYYVGADPVDPARPGLTRNDAFPYPGAYLQAVPRLNAGGGLVSTLPDMLALLRSLLPGEPALLKPETIALMMGNHLPEGQFIRFARTGTQVGRGFGLGGAVTLAPGPFDPAGSTGEFQWGGIAGTHWWISPRANLAGVVMTQRQMGFWNPFFFEFKQHVYRAVRR
jgi:CubicO group peptidase (beta-lactamase class C family)